MTNSPGAAVPVSAQLSSQFLSSLGVTFTSAGGFVAVVNHFPGIPSATPTFPNIIGGTSTAGLLDYNSPIAASFFVPSNSSVAATTNFVQVLGDRLPLGSGAATLSAFDINGNLLGSVSAPDVGPIGTGPVLSLSFSGIHSVSFSSDNGTVGFDNFEFGDLTVVPEPATWAMMLAGFGMVGFGLRSRRKQAVRVTYA